MSYSLLIGNKNYSSWSLRPWLLLKAFDIARNVTRLTALWTEARQRFGAHEPWLYGDFSVADAYFAPVAFRFQTYAVPVAGEAAAWYAAILAHPAMQAWAADAAAETEVVPYDEPEHVYGRG